MIPLDQPSGIKYFRVECRYKKPRHACKASGARQPLLRNGYMQNFTTRFWSQVEKTETCWNWTGYVMRGGYGRITSNGRQTGVHRVSYEMSGETIPDGMDVDHICRNRTCVRPDHLRLATRKENNENISGAYKNSKSGVRGVRWEKGKWRVQVGHNGTLHHVGYFTDIEDAKAAAIAKRNELFTHNEADRAA